MLSCIDQVRVGRMEPQTFQRAEVTRRTLNLSLSSVAVVEPVFTAAVFSLDIDSTGRYLLSGASDGSWYIHDTFNLSGKVDHTKHVAASCPRRAGHSRSIGTVEWYPTDSGMFVTSSSEGRLCLWDANNPTRPVDAYSLSGNVSRHNINPSMGSTIAVCCGGKVKLVDVRTGSAIQKLPETMTKSKEVRWNPAKQHELIVGSDEGHLIEWDVRSTLTYRGYGLLEVRVARRGVRTRDFAEQVNLLQKAHSGAITSIRYRRDGLEFYSMGEDGRIRRWMTDLSRSSFGSEPLICTLNYGKKSKKGGNLAMDISAETDLPIAFAPSGSSIKVCDMKDCRVRKELLGHFKQVNCFAYDSQYQIGYSGGNDAAVMVWSGHTIPEQTYLEDKITGEGSGADVNGRRKRNQGQLINLCEDDDFEEEYEVPSSSSSDEDIEGLRT